MSYYHNGRCTSISCPFETFILCRRQWARFLSSLSSLKKRVIIQWISPDENYFIAGHVYTSSVFTHRFLFWESLNLSVVQITPGSLLVKHSSSIPVTCVYDGFFYTNDRMIESERFPPCIKRHFLYPAVTRLATWRCWRLGAHIRTLSFSLSISLLIHDCMCVSRVCSIGGSRIGLHKGCN